MKRLEQTSIINDLSLLVASLPPPKADSDQMPGAVTTSVNSARQPLKPWVPKEYCQYPNAGRKDDYSLNEGLGSVSLQPAIDALNQFKQTCIASIKAQLHAIGPEATKDANLASGIADVTKQVYEAAKCFSQIVSNINKLVGNYIRAIDLITVDIVGKIRKLQTEITSLITLVTNTPSYLINSSITATLQELAMATDLPSLLNSLRRLQNSIDIIEDSLLSLDQTYNSARMHLLADLSLIQNTIMSLMYFMNIQGALGSHKRYASLCYMQNNYLDDFNVREYESLSFNWSITNSTALVNYNSDDSVNHVIEKLNALCGSYTPNNIIPIVVDAKQDSGYIVVPEGGILSCGLDPGATPDVSLMVELIIDHGNTIISATAPGSPVGEGEIIKVNQGVYSSNIVNEINYSTCYKVSSNIYRLTIIQDNPLPTLQSLYTFAFPGSSKPISYTVTLETGPVVTWKMILPMPFRVIETELNTVTVQRLSQAELKAVNYYADVPIGSIDDVVYVEDPIIDLPTANEPLYMAASNTVNDYIVADETNTPIEIATPGQESRYLTTMSGELADYINGGYTPATWNTYVDTIVNPLDPNYHKYVYYILNSSAALVKYDFNGFSNIPHAGQRIPCSSWMLRMNMIGDTDAIRQMRFSRSNPYSPYFIFFMKAQWGFIPN